MNFYKHYMGDYARDTAHLSLIEHGAYRVLLDVYYSTGKSLPADLNALYRIAKAMSAAERKAVEKVADEFFPINGDGSRHNHRADTEIAESAAYADAQAMRAHKRWHKSGSAEPPAKQEQAQCPDDASHSHSHRTSINSTSLSPDGDSAFAEFWTAYPRKTAKAKALTVWKRLKPDAPLLTAMLGAILAQSKTEQWQRGVIPHPATWLNQKRWMDEVQTLPSLGECQWNVNGNRDPFAGKCTAPAVMKKNDTPYCKDHGSRA